MPHIVVKIATERTDAEKADLTARITQAVIDALGHGDDVVSVAIESYAPGDWMAEVYEPEIMGKQDTLSKSPGYGPLAH